MARPTSTWSRRGAVFALLVALAADLVGLALGLSDDGFGWAFEMPYIVLSGVVAITASVATLILGTLRLAHQRGRDVLMWCAIPGALVTGLGGLILAMLSIAASNSV